MAIRITRKTRNIEKLIQRIRKANNKSVSTGYHTSQGNHSEYDMSYANLMSIHETAKFGLPERPVRRYTLNFMEDTYHNWSLAIKKYVQGKQDLDSSLHEIGIEATAEAKSIFGDPSQLTSNAQATINEKGFDAPLVDTGELRDKWSYKTYNSPVITNVSYG